MKPKTINYGGSHRLCLVKGICEAGDFAYEYLDYFTNHPENDGDKTVGKFLGKPNLDGYALIQKS